MDSTVIRDDGCPLRLLWVALGAGTVYFTCVLFGKGTHSLWEESWILHLRSRGV